MKGFQPASAAGQVRPVSPALTHPRNGQASCSSNSQASELRREEMDAQGDAVLLYWQGRPTAVTRDHNGLLLEPLPQTGCLSWCSGPGADVKYVPYSEILCCRYLPIRRYCSGLTPCQRKRHYMELQVLSRHPSRPWLWGLKRMELAAEQPDLVKAWVQHTRQRLRALPYRPQRLLVFVNPFGGKRQARRTWTKLAEPILAAAGVVCDLVETQYQGHAEELVAGLSLDQLQDLDGVVAVGGDGLFAELLTAVLQHKHLAAALQLRLGHIPAGSTDAVACTLHGTRDAVTAALHIALGDCTALDVGRMVTLPPADSQQQQQQPGESVPDTSTAGAAAAAWQQLKQPHLPQQLDVSRQSPAAAWDAGLSVGSHSELLLGAAGAVTSSSNGAAAMQASAEGYTAGSSSVQETRKQRQQQRRQAKQQRRQRKQAAQGDHQQQQQRQNVSLHIPQLRHFVCVANYGFLGDVMETSEKLRFCGPMRYDIAGVLRFLRLRQYKAVIWYKPAPVHAGDISTQTAAAGAAAEAAEPAAAADKKRQASRKQQRLAGPVAMLSPAAVLPLPHHRWPALHARLSLPGIRLPWWQQQQQGTDQQDELSPEQQDDSHEQQPCCAHTIASHLLNLNGSSHCSSESSSRRSSMDFSSLPLNTVTEGVVAGGAAHAAAPVSAFADAVASRPAVTGSAAPGAAAQTDGGVGDATGKQPQQQGKSVSFLPQLTAAVHASAASFSSKGSGISAGGIAAVLASVAPSRATSVSSHQSSRCHSRCSRCSAVALHRSTSRQTFAALTGAASPAAASPAAANDTAAAASKLPAAVAGHGPSSSGSHPSSPGRGSDTADGIVQVTPVPTPAGPSGAAAAAANGAAAGAAAACGAADGPPGPGWVKVEGEYCSVMCVVTSCISEKSRQGLMPEAHLADGRLALVMVEGCSRLQYLRFLIQLATKGIVPGSLPFVKVEYATEVQVEAEGRHSSWNVDGELLRHGRVNVGIHAGLVDVFARGVELM